MAETTVTARGCFSRNCSEGTAENQSKEWREKGKEKDQNQAKVDLQKWQKRKQQMKEITERLDTG